MYMLVGCWGVMENEVMKNRGGRAWENAQDGLRDAHEDVTRLLAHATADSTATTYLPNLRRVLDRWLLRGVGRLSVTALDRLLAQEFSRMCYEDGLGPTKGAQIFNALLHVAPEVNGRLPRAARSMKAWMKLMPGHERGPIPEEAVMYGAWTYFRQGKIYHRLIALLSMDCYLRSQDWSQLVNADVSCDSRSVALVFGVSRRGEASKGGCNQGVVIARGYLAEAMSAVVSLGGGSTAVFPWIPRKFRCSWQALWAKEGIKEGRTIHELRHTGASEDISRGRRDREAVRRRGRWRHLTSVDRYTKSHLLVAARKEFGDKVISRGARIARNPRKEFGEAIFFGEGGESPEAKAILKRWNQADRIPDSKECSRPSVESPRIEPLPDFDHLPASRLDDELERRGLEPNGSKANKIERLKASATRPFPVIFSLDSGDETMGTDGECFDYDVSGDDDNGEGVDDDDDDDASGSSAQGRRKLRLTARASKMRQ